MLRRQYYPKSFTHLIYPPIKIPMVFFVEIQKSILIFIWNLKGLQIAKTTLKKYKGGRLTLPDFKTYYRATVIKIVWYCNKNVYIEGIELRVKK